MQYVSEIEEQNLLMHEWRGADVVLWRYSASFRKALFILNKRDSPDGCFLIAAGSEFMRGPFAWKNACIYITKEIDSMMPRIGNGINVCKVVDESNDFVLICDTVIVVVGTQEELGEIQF